ncbi:MAG: hypothetical protein WD068_01905 [Candidatus Babeliales bacterium]
MKNFIFEYAATAHIDSSALGAAQAKLLHEIGHIKKALAQTQYETQYSSVYLAHDERMHADVQKLIAQKKKLSPTVLIVIGIGGSNLGTMAVHQALQGILYNALNPLLRVYFADTVDTDSMASMLGLVKSEYEKGNTVLLNVISKSGATAETVANFELFLEQLKKNRPDTWHEQVVVTTDKNSHLWHWGQKNGCSVVEIPSTVGGRYSVLSPVGLFPLGFLGIDIKALCTGARDILKNCSDTDLRINYAAIGAAAAYSLYQKGFAIHDLFMFDPAFELLGKWNRQLVAESLGKKFAIGGSVVEVGILPTVSIGSTDLHAIGQRYLGGAYTVFTTFVSVAQQSQSVTLPQWSEFDTLVNHIQGKSLEAIMDAIIVGTKFAYRQDERPFISIEFPQKSAYYIGQFMQYKMVETMYLAHLFDVNPFDQPNVEQYKLETKRILANE